MTVASRKRPLDATGYGIERTALPPFEQGRIDPREWFQDPAGPLQIEIGSGKGTFLVQQTALEPKASFLGIEQAGDFYRYAADRIRRHGLKNVRVLHADANEFIRFWCDDGVAAGIHVYFSDPWPKKRHHKRRVINDQSLRDFHRVLAPGGWVHLVTDHDQLWAWYEDHADRHADLFDRRAFEAPASARPGEMVGTNYERKYEPEGRAFRGMTLIRRDHA
jgi:tRNA (guanine-N7-)-methyltransferase